jgi:hypothetical protein
MRVQLADILGQMRQLHGKGLRRIGLGAMSGRTDTQLACSPVRTARPRIPAVGLEPGWPACGTPPGLPRR